MDVRREIRPAFLIGFLVLVVAVVVALAIRWATAPSGPAILIVEVTGQERTISLREIERLPPFQGEYYTNH